MDKVFSSLLSESVPTSPSDTQPHCPTSFCSLFPAPPTRSTFRLVGGPDSETDVIMGQKITLKFEVTSKQYSCPGIWVKNLTLCNNVSSYNVLSKDIAF
jgi:hypothetical protein